MHTLPIVSNFHHVVMISLRHSIAALCLLTPLCYSAVQAQTVALRTNALLWGAEAANVGIDFTINDYSTLGVSGVYSFRDSWIHKTNLRGAQLEYRYWFTHQPFYSMFVGPVAGLFHYRIDDDRSWQYTIPAGIQVGYAWALSQHWNLEAVYGVGYVYYTRETAATHPSGLLPDFAPEPSQDVINGQAPVALPSDEPQYTSHHKYTTINLGLSISYVF